MNTTSVSSTLADFRMQYYGYSTPRLLYVTVTSNEIIRNAMIINTLKKCSFPTFKATKKGSKSISNSYYPKILPTFHSKF